MAEDIITDVRNINLNELAARFANEFGEIDAADHEIKAVGHRGIGHAIAAGRYFFLVQQHVGCGFRRWLAARRISSTVRPITYTLLAEHAETVHRGGHSPDCRRCCVSCAQNWALPNALTNQNKLANGRTSRLEPRPPSPTATTDERRRFPRQRRRRTRSARR